MSEDFSFTAINNPDSYDLDIIFIHGLKGDSKSTWTNETDEFWPNWLVSDLVNIRAHTLNYSTSLFEKVAKKEMNLFERAESVLDYMASSGIGIEKPVAFITHSLGGLLIKQMLRTANESNDEDWQNIFKATCFVGFLATPHNGASLASVLHYCFPRLASPHIEYLTESNGVLYDLKKSYREIAPTGNIVTVAYYEKFKTGNVSLVVSEESSDPGVHGCRAIAVDADHLSICKPKNKDAPIYRSMLHKLKKVLIQPCEIKNSTLDLYAEDDFAAGATRDRRELIAKLIDAGREAEYDMVNDYQNKFAQKYYKLGLYSEEKKRSDVLLGDIEQRFHTHVYNPLICKDATDSEIADAIQFKVIDPIYKKHQGLIDGITEKLVLKGLYFLTEQCFIRWDPAK